MRFWPRVNQWWLWLTVFAIPLSTRKVLAPVFDQGDFVDYASVSIFLSDILLIGLLLVWLLSADRKQKFQWGPKAIAIPLILMGAWMTLSILWASPSPLLVAAPAVIRFWLYLGLYLYVINHVKDVMTLVYPLVVGVVVQGGVAVLQYFSNHSLGLKWLGESVLDPARSGIPVVLIDGVRHLRAHGTLPHANVLGGYLAVGLTLMWPLLFGSVKRFGQLAWWLVAGVGLVGLFLSLSRSAWVMLAVGGVLILIWLARRHSAKLWSSLKIGWPVMLTVLIIVLSQWQAIVPRLNSNPDLIEQISVSSRIKQWGEFKEVYSQHALAGVGIGQYFLHIWQPDQADSWSYQIGQGGWSYMTLKSLSYYQPVHDVYLLALAELGPVGLGLWLWIIGAAAYLMIRLGLRGSVWGLAGLWAIATIFGIGLVDHYWWTLPSGRLIAMLVLSSVAVLWVNSGYNGKRGRAKSTSIS